MRKETGWGRWSDFLKVTQTANGRARTLHSELPASSSAVFTALTPAAEPP